MSRFSVLVEVSLRPGIADPQGATIERALPALGFDSVHDVRTGKALRFSIDAEDTESAQRTVEALCQQFLTNPVIEEAKVTLQSESVDAQVDARVDAQVDARVDAQVDARVDARVEAAGT